MNLIYKEIYIYKYILNKLQTTISMFASQLQHFASGAALKQICHTLRTKVITVIIWAVSPIPCKIKLHATKPLKTN